jgi:integrase
MALEMHAPAQSKSLLLWQALEETYESRWKGTKSDLVVRRVVDVIAREIGHLPIADVNYLRLDAYAKALLRDGLAPATINRRMSTISTALNECMKRGELVQRPQFPHQREANIKDRYISTAEEASIWAELAKRVRVDEIMGKTDWLFIQHLATFLLDTGFRFSEVFAFRLDGNHADLTNADSKSGKGRRVPLTKRALAAAQFMLASGQMQALRAMQGKKPWDWCSHRWGLVTRDAGCPDVTLHILRHTCASRLVQKGVPIFTVSKWLGHSSVKVTERYAKLAPDSLNAALAAIETEPDETDGEPE